MIQSLDVISVNLWSILISLANLVILFLLVKKFLFGPINNILKKRDNEIEMQYESAKQSETDANNLKNEWEQKIKGASEKADSILEDATSNANARGEQIISEAQKRADGIIKQAHDEAQLEYKKATDSIKREIVEVSEALTQKILEREINKEDHHRLIDSFIENIGESHGTDN